MQYLMLSAMIFIKEFIIKNKVDDAEKLTDKTYMNGVFGLTRVRNKGLCFSLHEDKPDAVQFLTNIFASVFTGFALIKLLSKSQSKAYKFALALMLGGVASNQYDRITKGYVVDYISINKGPKTVRKYAFNHADVCILLGCIATVFLKKNKSIDS